MMAMRSKARAYAVSSGTRRVQEKNCRTPNFIATSLKRASRPTRPPREILVDAAPHCGRHLRDARLDRAQLVDSGAREIALAVLHRVDPARARVLVTQAHLALGTRARVGHDEAVRAVDVHRDHADDLQRPARREPRLLEQLAARALGGRLAWIEHTARCIPGAG